MTNPDEPIARNYADQAKRQMLHAVGTIEMVLVCRDGGWQQDTRDAAARALLEAVLSERPHPDNRTEAKPKKPYSKPVIRDVTVAVRGERSRLPRPWDAAPPGAFEPGRPIEGDEPERPTWPLYAAAVVLTSTVIWAVWWLL